MDRATEILICLGSAVAANCASCFSHYETKARAENLDPDDVKLAVDLGKKVNRGAHIALMKVVEGAASGKACSSGAGTAEGGPSCCR